MKATTNYWDDSGGIPAQGFALTNRLMGIRSLATSCDNIPITFWIDMYKVGLPQPLGLNCVGCASRQSQRRFHPNVQLNRPSLFPTFSPTSPKFSFSIPLLLSSSVMSETMASRFLRILCLCTCFSTVTYTAAPPVNVALDQPLKAMENV